MEKNICRHQCKLANKDILGRERRHEGAVNIWMFAQFSQLVLRSKSFCTTASSRVIFRRTVETSQIWSNCCSDYLVSVRVCVFVHVMALLSSKAEKWYTYTTHSFPQKGMVCSLIVCSFPKNSLGVLRQFSFFSPSSSLCLSSHSRPPPFLLSPYLLHHFLLSHSQAAPCFTFY